MLPDHVAVAAIINTNEEVLLSLRQSHQHQGGLWEFPGGKVECGEAVVDALQREIDEELGLTITQAQPLIKVPYDYDDKSVLLDVWQVEQFDGIPQGQEGQTLRWCAISELIAGDFPAANVPIIAALQKRSDLNESC